MTVIDKASKQSWSSFECKHTNDKNNSNHINILKTNEHKRERGKYNRKMKKFITLL